MDDEIPEKLFSQFLSYLDKHLGLSYTSNTIQDLKNKMPEMAKEFGYDNVRYWIDELLTSSVNQETITKLSKYLSIGETYFFRDAQYFQRLEEEVIKPLIASAKPEIKIWSAACSTGEEPYSLAILFDMLSNREEKKITIIASDINPEFLNLAKLGQYRDWSFRGVPEAIKNRYFTHNENGYLLNPEILNKVTFQYLNLIDGYYPSVLNNINNIDLILCNNVFIYFSTKQITQVIDRMSQSLSEGGYLCVTPIEAPFVQHPDLLPINKDLGFIFQKKTFNLTTFKSFNDFPEETENHPKRNVDVNDNISYNKLYEASNYKKIITLLESKSGKGEKLSLNELLLLVRSYANSGNFFQAKAWCEKFLHVYETSALLHYLYGTILNELAFNEKAIAELKIAEELDPALVIVNYQIGNILLAASQPMEAEKYFKNAINLLKNYPKEAIVPEGAGLTAGRLVELIEQGISY